MMLRECKKMVTGLFIAITLVGCGAEDSQFVRSFVYDVHDNQVELGLEFNQDIELNTDLTVPIKEYGEVKLIAGYGDKGFQITTSLNLDALVDPELLSVERTRLLPNGQPMSRYVETDVARVHYQPHEKIGTSLYLGLEESYRYLGAAVEIGFLDENFPAGLVISQRIRDSQGRYLGVITIYGPEVKDGKLVAPGGIFFITNVSDLIEYGKGTMSIASQNSEEALLPDSETYINEEYRKKYSEPKNIQKLIKIYKREGKKAGLVD